MTTARAVKLQQAALDALHAYDDSTDVIVIVCRGENAKAEFACVGRSAKPNAMALIVGASKAIDALMKLMLKRFTGGS